MSNSVKVKLETFWSDSLVTIEGDTLPSNPYKGCTKDGLSFIIIPKVIHCHEQGGSYNLNSYTFHDSVTMKEIDKDIIKGQILEVNIL